MTNAALVAKLESAKEGSRALSDEVLLAFGWRTGVGTHVDYYAWYPPDGPKHRSSDPRPDPTANLQAAVDLVPEGWGWLVEVWQREESWAQVVHRPKGSVQPSGIFEGAEAKSPALALSAAILKAVEAKDD